MIQLTESNRAGPYTENVDKARVIGRLTHWASRLLKRQAVASAPTPVYQDEPRYLAEWHRFEALQADGQPVRMKTRLMSSHSMVFRSDTELNLGEVITVGFEGMAISATVVHVHPTRRNFGGELELAPTPAQRALLLELVICYQEVAKPQPVCVLPRVVRKSGDKTRSRRIHSGSRKITTGSRALRSMTRKSS